MTDCIIIGVVLILVLAGVRASVKHFKGEGGCCGGTAYKPKKKKLRNPVVQKHVLKVQGMHCAHCVNTVTEIINDTDGASAAVSLRKKTAVILCDREIDLEAIKAKIRARGYEVS